MVDIAEMKAEMMELVRLNWPGPPMMNSPPTGSIVQGRGNDTPTHSGAAILKQGECNQVQERRRLRIANPLVLVHGEVEHYPGQHNLAYIVSPRVEFHTLTTTIPSIGFGAWKAIS